MRPTYSLGSSMRAIVIVLCVSSGHAYAQEISEHVGVADIVVTAQKREQNLQDVGVSVTAISSDDIIRQGITNAKSIAQLSAGVNFDSTSGGAMNANLTVRGVSQSDFSSIQESPNSVYIDEVYLSSPNSAAFTLYDIQRVEVLRGPQGTLFGRASSGGLASFITNRPTDTFEGYIDLGYGSYDSAHVEAAISGPLSDTVRARLSGRAERADGWFINKAPGGKDSFEKRFFGIRAQLEADLTEELTARVSLSYDRNPRHREGIYKIEAFYLDADGQPTPLPADLDVYGTGPGNDVFGYRDPYKSFHKGAFSNIGFLKNERVSPTLNMVWQGDDISITSITNWTQFKYSYVEDCDGGPANNCAFPLGQNSRQWSQELRVNGKAGAVDYTAGGYYLNVRQTAYQAFQFPTATGTPFAFSDLNLIAQKLKSYAVFGQVELPLAERLSLTVGARYTHDRKTFDSQVYFDELGTAFGGAGIYSPPLLTYDFSKATVGDLATESKGLWSGKVQLDYKVSQDALLYVSASRGSKGPGFNANVGNGVSIAETPFKREYLWAYEAGVKLELFDHRLRVNSSAFYYDYHDFQGYAFNGVAGVVGNYDGHFAGGELEITAAPGHGLEASLGIAYLDSKLKDVATKYGGVRDSEGAQAPKWTINGQVMKSFDVGPGSVSLQWSFDYIDDRYASIDNNRATLVKGSFVHNARIGYDLHDVGLGFAVFVNNISNQARQNYVFDEIPFYGDVIKSYAPPRWFGASVRKTF